MDIQKLTKIALEWVNNLDREQLLDFYFGFILNGQSDILNNTENLREVVRSYLLDLDVADLYDILEQFGQV